MALSSSDLAALSSPRPAFCRALQMRLAGPRPLSEAGRSRFSRETQSEIQASLHMFERMKTAPKESFVFKPLSVIKGLFSDTKDPVFWDQALWENAQIASQEN